MNTYCFICRHLGTSGSRSYFICHRKIIFVYRNCVLLSGAFHHCYFVVVVDIIVVVVVVVVCFAPILLIVILFCVRQNISVTFQMRLLLDRYQHDI